MKYGYMATYEDIEKILDSKSIKLLSTSGMVKNTKPWIWYAYQKERYGYTGKPPKILKFKIELVEVFDGDEIDD